MLDWFSNIWLHNSGLKALLQTWPIQFVVAAFFTIGFVVTYYQLWRRAFVTLRGQTRGYVARGELTAFGLVLGALLNVMGGLVSLNSNAMLFHNLGLFVFLFMLTDEGINLLEYLVRALAIFTLLVLLNAGALERWQFWLSLAAMTVLVVGIYVFDRELRVQTLTNTGVALLVGVSFWGGLPGRMIDMTVTPGIRIEAVLLLATMAYLARRYWRYQMRLADTSEKMTEQANFDSLTQVGSYSLYERIAPELIVAAQTQGTPLTAIMFDIDQFKQFNDEFGHMAGDAVLVGVAAIVRKTMDQYDEPYHFYRVGGEEFIVFLPNMTVTQATRIARDCYYAVRTANFTYEATDLHVTISLGMTALRPDDRDLADLYKRVDEFLYLSKRAGRNVITIEGRTENSVGAKAADGYCFFAQPIVQVHADGYDIIARELLLRMRSSDGLRWVLPNTFDLDVHVLLALLKQALDRSACKHLGINLLPSQFSDLNVARTLAAFVMSEPDMTLNVEVTGVPELKMMSMVAGIYHDVGVRISLDGVGSENHYEAIAPLLPYVDSLKFSLQNLRRQHDTENLESRLQFWQQVARDNDCLLVVAGIETRRDAVRMHTRFGIDYQQGYLYGRPSIPND